LGVPVRIVDQNVLPAAALGQKQKKKTTSV